jgi:hypothetical protein
VGCAAAAGTLPLGAAVAADRPDPAPAPLRVTAAAKPLAGLNATFKRVAAGAKCAAAGSKATQARKLRAAANRNVAKATPKALKAKKAKMRRAIRVLRAAKKLCDEAGTTPGGGAGSGPPPPPPSPPPPGVQTFAFTGTNFVFSPAAPVAVSAGAPIRLQVTNAAADTDHRIGVRGLDQPAITESQIAAPGASASVDVTLPAGVYEIFCGVDGHDMLGMIVDLNVGP